MGFSRLQSIQNVIINIIIGDKWKRIFTNKHEKYWTFSGKHTENCKIRSSYSCSEVCIRVGGVKWQPSTVGFGLRQGCMLSTLFCIVCITWIDSHSWGNKVTLLGSAGSNICFLRMVWYCSHQGRICSAGRL